MLAKRKGEKHKRIKCSTLARLMTENNYEESIYNLNENGGENNSVRSGSRQDGQQENIMGLLS